MNAKCVDSSGLPSLAGPGPQSLWASFEDICNKDQLPITSIAGQPYVIRRLACFEQICPSDRDEEADREKVAVNGNSDAKTAVEQTFAAEEDRLKQPFTLWPATVSHPSAFPSITALEEQQAKVKTSERVGRKMRPRRLYRVES